MISKNISHQKRESQLRTLMKQELTGESITLDGVQEVLKGLGIEYERHPVTYSSKMEKSGFLMTGQTSISFNVEGCAVEIAMISTAGYCYSKCYYLRIGDYLKDMSIDDWTLSTVEVFIARFSELKFLWQKEIQMEERETDKKIKVHSFQKAAVQTKLCSYFCGSHYSYSIESAGVGLFLFVILGQRVLKMSFSSKIEELPSKEDLLKSIELFEHLICTFGRNVVIGATSFPSLSLCDNPYCSLETMHKAISYLNEESCISLHNAKVHRNRYSALVQYSLNGLPIIFQMPYESIREVHKQIIEEMARLDDCPCSIINETRNICIL